MSIITYLAVAAVALYCMLLLVKVKRHVARHRLQSSNEVELSLESSQDNNGSRSHPSSDEAHSLEDTNGSEAKTEALTFEDVGHALFGWWGRFLVDLCILSSQIGFCVVYQIFLGDTTHGLFPSIPKLACMLLPVPILIAVCQIRRLKWLAATSFLALFVFGIGFAICLIFSWQGRSERDNAPYVQLPHSASSFATLISFAVFSFEGIGLVLPLENSIRPDVAPIFTRLFSATVGAVTLLYTLVGALGYIAWGSDVGSSLLDNVIKLQGRSPFVITVLVGFLIGGFCSYPLNMFPVTSRFEILFNLADNNGNDKPGARYVTLRRTLIRVGLVILALALAIAIPSFALFISLIGSLFSTALAFVFPTFFHMKAFSWPSHWPSGPLKLGSGALHLRDNVSTKKNIFQKYGAVGFDIFVCLFGIVATIVCSAVSMINIVDAIKNGTIMWSFQTNPSPSAPIAAPTIPSITPSPMAL